MQGASYQAIIHEILDLDEHVFMIRYLSIPEAVVCGQLMMLDWFRYRYQLARLQREKRRTQAYHQKAWNKAKHGKQPEEELETLRYTRCTKLR